MVTQVGLPGRRDWPGCGVGVGSLDCTPTRPVQIQAQREALAPGQGSHCHTPRCCSTAQQPHRERTLLCAERQLCARPRAVRVAECSVFLSGDVLLLLVGTIRAQTQDQLHNLWGPLFKKH